MELQKWFVDVFFTNDSSLTYKETAAEEIMFMRDKIARIFKSDFNVIGTHKSKSLTLPVMQISTEHLTLTVRDNFYNYAISVTLKKNIDWVFDGVFESSADDNLKTIYFEGFPSDLVYGSFRENPTQLSLHINSKEMFYVFCFLLNRAMILS